MIGEVYSTDVSTQFCNQSTETQPNPCCLCPANTSCDLTCPREWKKIRGNKVQCPNQTMNPDKFNISTEYDYMFNSTEYHDADYYNVEYEYANFGDMSPGDSESPQTQNGTFTLSKNTYILYCVAECPVRTFYEHRDLKCHPCDPSCKACDGPNATGCTACEFKTDDGCMKECPPGWEPILDRKGRRRGTVCKIRVSDVGWKPQTAVIVGAAVTVGAFIVVGVAIAVWWLKLCDRGRTGNCSKVQTQNKRSKPNRYVRGKNDFDASGFTDERQPFTGNTEDANYHLYNEIEDKIKEVKYDYADAKCVVEQKKPVESEEGYEPIEGDFQDVTHDIHVDEDIYEEMGVSRTSKSPTPRAGQEPYLTHVAESAVINIGKTELGVSTAPDISKSDNDRTCVDENTINTAGNLSNEPLTIDDVCNTAAYRTEDYLVPISRTAKDASTIGAIDNINSNVDVTQIKTEQTREGIMDDGNECAFYTIATDNKGGLTDSVAAAGGESDSAKKLHFHMMGLQHASNKNETKRGNSRSNDITGRKPKLKPKPLPKAYIQPIVASEIGVEQAVKPVSERVPEKSTDFDVISKLRHIKPVPLPRKQMKSSDGTVNDDKQMTKQDYVPGKKAIPKYLSDFNENDTIKAQSCKYEFPEKPDTALSDVFKDKVQQTGHYTDVLSVDDLKDASKYNRVNEEPSSEMDLTEMSSPKLVSLSFSEEEIKEILGETKKIFFE
ncbi:hypothetical protein DPMN_155930 [Dreissena polymorpha]|uniref:Uncharacterized protein n=2 Tax=Dreissena polymorpha TaxID=45954 RepID=A0A9D4FPR4_DREPO|nr:hypothetical protein DPMN_155930 [Dreissena polymorpha]